MNLIFGAYGSPGPLLADQTLPISRTSMEISTAIDLPGFPKEGLLKACLRAIGRLLHPYRKEPLFHVGSWPWCGWAGGMVEPDNDHARGLFGGRSGGGGDPSHKDGEPEEPEPRAFYHESVMLEEVIRLMEPGPGKLVFDGT